MTRHIFLFLHRHSFPTPAATAIGSAPRTPTTIMLPLALSYYNGAAS